MRKYAPLWEAVSRHGEDRLRMAFAEAEQILGFPIDHSFLYYKKELTSYGWQVGKISLNAQTLLFERSAAPESGYHHADVLFFFDGRPDALPLYTALTDRMKKTLPEFTVEVQKSQICFCNRHLFAMVSLPRRKSERGLSVSFGLSYRLDSPRVAVATEPYPNRWTHHVPVTEAARVDEELLGWLREAYDFAAAKAR